MQKLHDLPGWKIVRWVEKLGWCFRAYDTDLTNLERRLSNIQKADPNNQYIIQRCRKSKRLNSLNKD